MMYENRDVLLPEDELLLIMQSRRWQEEPDLIAIDKNGDLCIFELKAWESHESKLLQVLDFSITLSFRIKRNINNLTFIQ